MLTSYVPKKYVKEPFRAICKKHELLECLDGDDLFLLAPEEALCFRVNDFHCDCGTAIGGGEDADSEEMQRYLAFWKELQSNGRMSYITLFKHWASDERPNPLITEKIHIDDLDERYLASMKTDVLYKIHLYKRRYSL